MEISYSYSTRMSGVNYNGNGCLSSQGLMWKMSGNGVDMYCDAKSLWIVDSTMKEVVIEPAASEAESEWLSNPAIIFSRIKDTFKVRDIINSADGKSLLYVLDPLKQGSISYCNLELNKSDASIKYAVVALTDGTYIKIEVSSMKLTPKVSIEAFRPRIDFDSSWILTDLR